ECGGGGRDVWTADELPGEVDGALTQAAELVPPPRVELVEVDPRAEEGPRRHLVRRPADAVVVPRAREETSAQVGGEARRRRRRLLRQTPEPGRERGIALVPLDEGGVEAVVHPPLALLGDDADLPGGDDVPGVRRLLERREVLPERVRDEREVL